MRTLPRTITPTLTHSTPEDELLASEWALALAQPEFRRLALGMVLLLATMVGVVIPPFFTWMQQRPGMLLPDPLLTLLPHHDVALAIFVLMYGAVGLGMGWLLRHPALLLRGLWAYGLLLLLRVACIWLVPLAPPSGLLPMPDPFTAHVFHMAGSEAITKDLFFSGHTATVVLLALAVRGRWWRWVLALLALAVGLLVLVQRVHYSYDVLAAPFFAWLAYWVAGRLVHLETNNELPTSSPLL